MKALTYGSFGPPEVIRVEDVADPVPAFDDVRVRVYATSVTAADASFRSGKPLSARLYAGPFRPRFPTLGGLVSGEVDAVGSGVTRLRVGDRVLGFTGPRLGAHAGYVCLPAGGAVVSKPADLTDVQSVAACEGAIVALPFLRDEAHLRPGRSVLINGASGSVGSAAVQVAKHFGAHVTAVCRGCERRPGLRPAAEVAKDLVLLTELAAGGHIRPVIDATYPLERAVQAHARVDSGHKVGTVVLTLDGRSGA